MQQQGLAHIVLAAERQEAGQKVEVRPEERVSVGMDSEERYRSLAPLPRILPNTAAHNTTSTATTTAIVPNGLITPSMASASSSVAKGASNTSNTGNGERICQNCRTTRTPLWRRSPLGPKTLCNACGVRMKKGRLIFIASTQTFCTIESNKRKRDGVSKERRKRSGLHYLLAAIEFVETN